MTRSLAALASLTLLAATSFVGVTATAAQTPAQTPAMVTIEISPTEIDVDLGDRTDIELTITNTSDAALSGAVAHIDVVDLGSDESADAEDWSSVLNQPIPTIDPGESTTITWDIQPIAPGTYTLYAVALDPAAQAIAVTDAVTIDVADKRSLNPNGILPVAVAAPTLVGLLLAKRFRRHRA